MSEFGNSFHLAGINRTEAQRITRLLKAPSVLFVSPKGSDVHSLITLATPEQIFKYYFETFINYTYGEDQGLQIEIYAFTEKILLANIIWEGTKTECNISIVEKDRLLKCGLFNNKKSLDVFLEKLNQTTAKNIFEIAATLGLPHYRHVQHEELRHLSVEQLKKNYPRATIHGFDKMEKFLPQSLSNEWCALEGQPHYMYLPVPVVKLNEKTQQLFKKHKQYWLWWDKNVNDMLTLQEQFKVLEFYRRKLPKEWEHLDDRFFAINNDSQWKDARWKTLAAIISLIAVDEKQIQKLEEVVLIK
jgi:hypothetical protein